MTTMLSSLVGILCVASSLLAAELSPDLGLGFRYVEVYSCRQINCSLNGSHFPPCCRRQSEAQYQIDYFRTPINLDGWVVNDQGVPINEAFVSLQDKSAMTDQVGYFQLTDLQRENGLLQVTKEGFRTQLTPVHLLKK